MIKLFSTAATCLLLIQLSAAQTNTFPATGSAGIGTTTPNASALLDMVSTSKGMLVPRMTKAQRDLIGSPATGLLIYQTDNTPGFYYHNGTAWAVLKPADAGKKLNNLTAPTAVNVELLPGADNSINLGSASKSWKDIYLDGALFIGGNKFAFTSATNSTFIGNTGNTANTGVKNTSAGFDALRLNTSGGFNTATGFSALRANATGTNNSAFGANALLVNSTGSSNTAIGTAALSTNTTGAANTAIGTSALLSNTTGNNNTAIGSDALISNSTGNGSTAVGSGAMYNNTFGYNNTAVGTATLFANTGGWSNTAVGNASLFSSTSGAQNTAVGDSTLYANIGGSNNTALGFVALRSNISGILNTGIGALALKNSTTGDQNTAVGATALYLNTTGHANTAIGDAAMFSNTAGGWNTALGIFAMNQNTVGGGNLALGASVLQYNDSGSNNVAAGFIAMRYNQTGSYNVAVGYNSLGENNGSGNVAIGAHAMSNSSISSNNIAIGDSAMHYYNSPYINDQLVAVGYRALMNNDAGYFNTALGSDALRDNESGYNNTATGTTALSNNEDGHDNTAQGYGALGSNSIGNRNSAFGSGALINSEGENNTACGFNALVFTGTGNYNTAVGANALRNNTTGSNNMGLGDSTAVGFNNLTNATAIGSHAVVYASNAMVLGSIAGLNGATVTVNVGVGTTSPGRRMHVRVSGAPGVTSNASTGLLLEDNAPTYLSILTPNASQNGILFGNVNSNQGGAIIFNNAANPDGLQLNAGAATRMSITSGGNVGIGLNAPSFQLQVNTNSAAKPTSSSWTVPSDARLKKDVKEFKDGMNVIEKLNPVWFTYTGKAGLPANETGIGTVAQELQKIAPYMVNEWTYTDTTGAKQKYLGVDYGAMDFILVNSIKEQQKKIEEKDEAVKNLEEAIAGLQKENISKQQQIESLENAMKNFSEALSQCCMNYKPASADLNQANVDIAWLEQNTPNPFNERTMLRCYIPQSISKAVIIIYSLTGEELKSIPVNAKGVNHIEIAAGTFSPGTYSYLLIVDGKTIDTKQMIVTK